MIIRKETGKDFNQIYDMVKIAFKTAKVSNGKEQDFVNQLRNSSNYIPELALVAEENDILIGHIMLTQIYVHNGDNNYEALLLAPISVVLEHRDKGIGSNLIHESFSLAKEIGYTAVFLVGDPAYYHRFRFKSSIDFDIKNTNNIPDKYVMACELVPDALHGIKGEIAF